MFRRWCFGCFWCLKIKKYENNIEDIDEEIYVGMNGVDDDIFLIYTGYWHNKVEALSFMLEIVLIIQKLNY